MFLVVALVLVQSLVVAACTPGAETSDVDDTAVTETTGGDIGGEPSQPEQAPAGSSGLDAVEPPELLQIVDPAPILVAPGEALEVLEGTEAAQLVAAGTAIDLQIVDGRVTIPDDADGELLLVEHRGETIRPRALYVAEGTGIRLVPSHTELTPGDVAILWPLRPEGAPAEILLLVGSADDPTGALTAGPDPFLAAGLPEPIDLAALGDGPLLLPYDTVAEVASSGVAVLDVVTERGGTVQRLEFSVCAAPAKVEGTLGGAGRVRLLSLAPAGRSGALRTPDGAFRFLTPPGPVLVGGEGPDGQPIRSTGRVGCGQTAAVGSGVAGEQPTELDLAQVTVGALGEIEPDRACRTATVGGSGARAAALSLDELPGLDVLTADDLERAIAAVEDGTIRPVELVTGLAARWSPDALTVAAVEDGVVVEPAIPGDLPVRVPADTDPAAAVNDAVLCIAAGAGVAEPGEEGELTVQVTGLDRRGRPATVEVVRSDTGDVLGTAQTDADGVAVARWTAPPQPGVFSVDVEVTGTGAVGSAVPGVMLAAARAAPAPTGSASTSAVVGGNWVVLGSQWATLSGEFLLVEGAAVGSAILACSEGARLSGPWAGTVWIGTGGIYTIGVVGLAMTGLLGLDTLQELLPDEPERFFAKLLAGPAILDSVLLPVTPLLLNDVLTRIGSGGLPDQLLPRDGVAVEVFTIPFSDVDGSSRSQTPGAGRVPLRSGVGRGSAGFSIPLTEGAIDVVFGPSWSGSAVVRGPGGTLTKARLYWSPSCTLGR